MKKKIIILIIITALILGLIVGLNLYKSYSNYKRYEQIKSDIKNDVADYLRVTVPYCEVGSNFLITDEILVNIRGMDKEKLLDVDNKSYCKARIDITCVGENEWSWDTYLSCKDYEDERYSNLDKIVEPKIEFNEKEKKIIDAMYNKFNIYQYFDEDNLETLEIVYLEKFGYYETESNRLYVTVYYNSKCKDDSYECDKLDRHKEYNISNGKPFDFLIVIDVNTYDYVRKIDGFATNINSDWKYVSGRVK